MDAKISEQFWQDPEILDQGPEVKLAALWLLTNSARSLCGFQIMSHKRFEFETGLPPEALDSCLQALPSTFKALGKGIWIVNFVRWQFGAGKQLAHNNVAKAIVKEVNSLGIDELTQQFGEVYPTLKDFLDNPFEAPCKPLVSPSEGYKEGDKPSEAPREEKSRAEQRGRDSKEKGGGWAERIYQAYPRKVAKPNGLKAIEKALRSVAPEVLLQRTQEYARQRDGTELEFTPHPATWFNQERYNDISIASSAGSVPVIRAASERWLASWTGQEPSEAMARDLIDSFPADVQRADVYEICESEFAQKLREFVDRLLSGEGSNANDA